jgi:uncharacterized membrane protein YfcA
VDADRIAAIDNVTRKMMQAGKRPIAVGLMFTLGHSPSTQHPIRPPYVAPPAFITAEGWPPFFRMVTLDKWWNNGNPRSISSASLIDFSAPRVLAIAMTFFVAGVVKGVTGMGLPTVAMGLLGTMMPPVVAASLLILPSFITNGWQLLAGPRFAVLARRLWSMMLGIAIGTVFGLGCALMLYAASGLLALQWSVPAKMERLLSPVMGAVTGLVAGSTGVLVMPAVPYLQALGLAKEELIQALGLSFTVSTIALAIGLARGGSFQLGNIEASFLAVAPALFGMWAGQRIRQRVSPVTFRRWFFVCLFLLGLQLTLQRFM